MGLALLAGAAYGGLTISRAALDQVGGEASSSPDPGRAPLRVAAERVQARDFSDRVRAVGSTRAHRSIEIFPLASGRVTEILFRPGQEVEEGAPLLRLDDAAERAALDFARATLMEATAAYDRATQLMEGNISSRSLQESARATALRAQAEVEQAEKALRDREIRAAFGGVLGLTEVEVGSRVEPATLVTTLDDLSEVEIAFTVPERFRARIAPDQRIVARSTGFPDRVFEGRVAAIDSRVAASSRSVALRASLPNADDALVGGMFMDVEIVLSERQAPAVAEVALVSEGTRTYVYALENGHAVRREVETGAMSGPLVEVVRGLEPGAAVIVSNLHQLADGRAVDAIDAADVAGRERTP